MREPSMILNKWERQIPVRRAMSVSEPGPRPEPVTGVLPGDTWS